MIHNSVRKTVKDFKGTKDDGVSYWWNSGWCVEAFVGLSDSTVLCIFHCLYLPCKETTGHRLNNQVIVIMEQRLAIFMEPKATRPSQENLPGSCLMEPSLIGALPSGQGTANRENFSREIHPSL